MIYAEKTMCCLLQMKCKQELRAQGNCLPAIMKEYIPISLFWEKHYREELIRYRQYCPINKLWTLSNLVNTDQHLVEIR